MKKQVGMSIKNLTKTVVGPRATDAAQTRLAVTYVSDAGPQFCLMLTDDSSKTWRIWRIELQ